MDFRVGIGTDLHKLTEGAPLVLGGITIPWQRGSSGHSDGDVLIHAICDAILGALALRDIGFHFPDTDPQYKGVSSIGFLKKVVDLVREKGWKIINIDTTVHLQEPKLSPFIPAIQQSLSGILVTEAANISVKAKTGERIGIIGEGKAIEAMAICLLSRDVSNQGS